MLAFRKTKHCGFKKHSEMTDILFAGAFISAMIAYALKPNQTKDLTPKIFEEPAKPKNL
jgi:hypothetical protein